MALADHPATWSAPVLEALGPIVASFARSIGATEAHPCDLLDPFAGTGGIHALADDPVIRTFGIELEPEWAANDPRTMVGDAAALPPECFADRFDVVATSPCFGNRMADHHEAADPCKTCRGRGLIGEALEDRVECPTCKGRGLSLRNTYRHVLGRPLTEGSAAGMQWGMDYREFHTRVIAEWERVLRPGGIAVVNMKNHLRTRRRGEPIEQRVVEWWANTMICRTWGLLEVRRVRSAGNRNGANGGARVESEALLIMRRPDGA